MRIRSTRGLGVVAIILSGSLPLACDTKPTPTPAGSVTSGASSTANAAGSNAAPTRTTASPLGVSGVATAKPGDIPAPEDVAKPPADAKKEASGLVTKVLKAGTGEDMPTTDDSVKVHYSGWQQSDGKMFDSSVARGEPISFAVTGVIKGWTEGLQLMKVGEQRRFWIPADLAYGEKPRRPGAPAGPLTFDVELLEIVKPPQAPADVKAAPADAKKTASGLAYKVITKGTGTTKPGPTTRVRVHYSGWTPDGKLFDSSVTKGRPITFGLDGVIKGWTEGVQLMVEGEKTLFWIPSDLAYGDKPSRPGAPAGPLVFEVELLQIVN